jgi:hypothetical protein
MGSRREGRETTAVVIAHKAIKNPARIAQKKDSMYTIY